MLAVLRRSPPVAANHDGAEPQLTRPHAGLVEPMEDLPIEVPDRIHARLSTPARQQVVRDGVEGRDDVFDLAVQVLLRRRRVEARPSTMAST